MRDALESPALLADALPGESWALWRTLLIAAMGEALTEEERAAFHAVTGRESEPGELVEEFWAIVGRRGGKTRAAGTLAAYVGTLCDHGAYLAPGERGVIPILAASTYQAGKAFAHARGVLEASPELLHQIEGEPLAGTIKLKTRVDIEVRPANFRTVRSITAVAAVCDEVAFWHIDGSANPDKEILNALRPALGTTGGPLMVISSPHAKKGELYEAWRKDYGPNGDGLVLVANGPSRLFNSTLSERLVKRAYAKDQAAAQAEYGGLFRNDVEAFVSRETVEACVMTGVAERAPAEGVTYWAFVDPSGGGADSFTLSIGHKEGSRGVMDALRERKPPFSPEAVVAEYAALLKSYGISAVTGDRYAGEWPREAFRRHGIEYRLAELPKSQLYVGMLPILNSGRIDLLDVPGVVDQVANLERRVARGGRESIDHPPHGHDDVANVVAGLIGLVIRRIAPPVAVFGTYSNGIGAHPLVGTRVTAAPAPRPSIAEELPPPAWVRNPATAQEAENARAYFAERARH
jgi:hypothetical protein